LKSSEFPFHAIGTTAGGCSVTASVTTFGTSALVVLPPSSAVGDGSVAALCLASVGRLPLSAWPCWQHTVNGLIDVTRGHCDKFRVSNPKPYTALSVCGGRGVGHYPFPS
jgi:hypothetical protein